MPRGFSKSTARWVSSALLIALVFRALIPAGFMPSADQPFSLQICPDGLPSRPAALTATAHHPGHHPAEHHAHSGHEAQPASGSQHPGAQHHSGTADTCAFAAAAGGMGPASSETAATFLPRLPAMAIAARPTAHVTSRHYRPYQSRAPPPIS